MYIPADPRRLNLNPKHRIDAKASDRTRGITPLVIA